MPSKKSSLPIDLAIRKFLIPILRRSTYKWKPRYEAIKAARISRGLYECRGCKKHVKNKEFHLDHIIPVVSHHGFIDWNEYILRLFASQSGWALLCIECHERKTLNENSLRV